MAKATVIDPKKKPTARTGVGSGASLYSGRFVNEILRDPEELVDPSRRHATFRVMAQTDAYIAESLRANILPLIAEAEWSVVPPKKKKKKKDVKPTVSPKIAAAVEDPENEEPETDARTEDICEFLECALLGEESESYGSEYRMQSTWSQLIREITMFLPHGFAVFHKEYKAVGDKLVYQRLLWLEPQTIWEWNIDGSDNFIGITRQYRKADSTSVNNEFIPINELLLFVWDITGTRLEGVPLLRSMYGPWKRKEFIERCKMIALQQAGVGIPVATWDPEKWGNTDNTKVLEDRIEEALQSSLGSGLGTAYLAVPNDTFQASYMRQSSSEIESFDKLAAQESLAEAHGGGTKSMMTGETGTGSRNSSSVHRSLEYVMTLAVAQIISEQLVMGVAGCKGPVKDLCDLNYSGTKQYPLVKVTDVDPDESTRTLPLVKDLMSAGALKYRLSAEQELWKRVGIDLPDEEFDPDNPVNQEKPPVMIGPDGKPINNPLQPGVPPQRTKVPSPSGPKGGAPRVAKPSDNNRVEARGNKLEGFREARRDALRLGVESLLRWPAYVPEGVAASYRRAPTEFEVRTCLLAQIEASLTNGAASLGAQMLAARATMIADLTARMEAGKVNRRNLPGLRRSKPKGVAPHQAKMKERWLDVAKMGRAQAAGELERQKSIDVSTLGLAEGDSKDHYNQLPPGAALPADAQVPAWVIEATVQEFQAEVDAEALLGVEIAVDELWARLLDEAINTYMRLSRPGVSEAEVAKQVEAVLQGLSPKPELLVGKELSNVAYNQGRDVAIKEAAKAGEARYAMRSEVLDSNTCDVCPGLDGIIVLIGTPEYEQLMPPSRCLGGDGCRGFYVILADALMAPTKGANNG